MLKTNVTEMDRIANVVSMKRRERNHGGYDLKRESTIPARARPVMMLKRPGGMGIMSPSHAMSDGITLNPRLGQVGEPSGEMAYPQRTPPKNERMQAP